MYRSHSASVGQREQRLVRNLDIRAVVLRALDQQPRVDQPVDQAARLRWQVVKSRVAASEGFALLGEPTKPRVNTSRSA